MTLPLRILILTPTALPSITGNAMTAERWRRSLAGMGHAVKTLSSQNADQEGLSREIRSFQPDIIHAHHALKAGALLLNRAVKAATGSIPFVVSPAGTDINHDRAPDGTAEGTFEILLKVCRASKGIITQSPWVFKRITDLLPGMEDRIVQVPKAFLWQGDELIDLKGDCGDRSGLFLFFIPAGIRPIKGNLECLRWLETVYCARPSVRAVFAGPALDAVYAARFEEEIRRLSAFARWIPRIPPAAMRSAYGSADAVLNASFSEGLSNTLLEAIAAGRPILASDIPGNRWPVLGNQNDRPCGYLFDHRNPDDFIREAIRLFDDEGLRRGFVEACRERAANLPRPDDEADGLDRVYHSVLRI
ncbi:MAG: glycosyltransferase [Deltaproteobacteria bacterium]|nr:glycosyltransferase [Deltaproteobacteria bacterium]